MRSDLIRRKVNDYMELEENLHLELRKLEETHEELQHVKKRIETIDEAFREEYGRNLRLFETYAPGAQDARCVGSGRNLLLEELSNEQYRTIMSKAEAAKDRVVRDIDTAYQAIQDKETELRKTVSTRMYWERQLQQALLAEFTDTQTYNDIVQ